MRRQGFPQTVRFNDTAPVEVLFEDREVGVTAITEPRRCAKFEEFGAHVRLPGLTGTWLVVGNCYELVGGFFFF